MLESLACSSIDYSGAAQNLVAAVLPFFYEPLAFGVAHLHPL